MWCITYSVLRDGVVLYDHELIEVWADGKAISEINSEGFIRVNRTLLLSDVFIIHESVEVV